MTASNVLSQLGSPGVSTGFKNRIINGAMLIDQRNAGSSVSLSNSTVFSVDRFQASDSGSGVFTAQQSSDAPAGFLKSVVLTVTTADSSLTGADYYQIQQRIEGYNLADLNIGTANAKTTTLSFWVKGSITGSYSLAILREGATGGCRSYVTTYTINTANTWEYKTITIPMDTSVAQNTTEQTNGNALYVGWQFGTGTTYQTATLNQWQTGVYVAGTSTTQWISTLGATVYITGVQLEVGTTATNFEVRSVGTELALCQRYYQDYWSGSYSYPLGPSGYTYSTANTASCHVLPVAMRATPSVTFRGTLNIRAGRVDGGNTEVTPSGIADVTGNQTNTLVTYTYIASSAVLAVGTMSCLCNGATGRNNGISYSAEL